VSERPKSTIYQAALPLLNATRIALLDLPRLHAVSRLSAPRKMSET
jgi:hypothetical protein